MKHLKCVFLSLLVGFILTGNAMATAESEPLNVLEIKVQNDEGLKEQGNNLDSLCYYIELASQPDITCYHQQMIVRWLDDSNELEELQLGVDVRMRLISASDIPDAVTETKGADSHVVIDAKESGIIRVRGIQKGTPVQAYAIDGRVVATVIAGTNGVAIINLNSQPRGLYIISVNQHETFKILKP